MRLSSSFLVFLFFSLLGFFPFGLCQGPSTAPEEFSSPSYSSSSCRLNDPPAHFPDILPQFPNPIKSLLHNFHTLFGIEATKHFLSRHWEILPLHVHRPDQGNYFHSLFHISQLDILLDTLGSIENIDSSTGLEGEIQDSDLKLVKKQWNSSIEDYQTVYFPLEKILKEIQENKASSSPLSSLSHAIHQLYSDHQLTIVLNQLNSRHSLLFQLNRIFSFLLFGFRTNINMYLTPSNARGFHKHSDWMESIIIQLYGKKQWLLYDSNYQNPGIHLPRADMNIMDYSDRRYRELEENNPPQEVFMVSGDVLYIPSGTIHEARTINSSESSKDKKKSSDSKEAEDDISLHLTIGVEIDPIYSISGLFHTLVEKVRSGGIFSHLLPLAPTAKAKGENEGKSSSSEKDNEKTSEMEYHRRESIADKNFDYSSHSIDSLKKFLNSPIRQWNFSEIPIFQRYPQLNPFHSFPASSMMKWSTMIHYSQFFHSSQRENVYLRQSLYGLHYLHESYHFSTPSEFLPLFALWNKIGNSWVEWNYQLEQGKTIFLAGKKGIWKELVDFSMDRQRKREAAKNIKGKGEFREIPDTFIGPLVNSFESSPFPALFANRQEFLAKSSISLTPQEKIQWETALDDYSNWISMEYYEFSDRFYHSVMKSSHHQVFIGTANGQGGQGNKIGQMYQLNSLHESSLYSLSGRNDYELRKWDWQSVCHVFQHSQRQNEWIRERKQQLHTIVGGRGGFDAHGVAMDETDPLIVQAREILKEMADYTTAEGEEGGNSQESPKADDKKPSASKIAEELKKKVENGKKAAPASSASSSSGTPGEKEKTVKKPIKKSSPAATATKK